MNAREYRKASASIKRQYRRKMRRERPLISSLGLPLVMAVVVIASGGFIVANRVALDEKQAELDALREQVDVFEAENASYKSILDEEDERTYMERIAQERLGYAYPDEHRFYDTMLLS
ncbi:MAG: hypothetical protein K6G68_08995 [Oscillospiraceae bacterium]|nr:hypothetical protein [Oscillospiraceae bacterium]